MLKAKIFVYIFTLLLLISFVNATTIYGTVYDLSLKKVNNAWVEINTSPKQFLVAQNATYSFNVPNGKYTIKAQLMRKNTAIASVQENITIIQDGDYVLDMILFPDLEEGIKDIDLDINDNVIEDIDAKYGILLFGFLFLFIPGIVIGVFYFLKTRKGKKNEVKESKTESADLDLLIKIIKQEGGRTTQRDIRKQIPLSEAKISLMIAELEHKGVIEKIKKGRGNIIILRKK